MHTRATFPLLHHSPDLSIVYSTLLHDDDDDDDDDDTQHGSGDRSIGRTSAFSLEIRAHTITVPHRQPFLHLYIVILYYHLYINPCTVILRHLRSNPFQTPTPNTISDTPTLTPNTIINHTIHWLSSYSTVYHSAHT